MKRLLLAVALFAAIPLSAAWTSHGPIGGQILGLAIAPTDRRVIYAAAPDGLFRSGDAGATWRNVGGPIDAPAAVVVSGADPNVVVAAGSNGVFRSDDAGATWQLAAGLPKILEHAELLINPRDPNVVYLLNLRWSSPIVTTPGVYKSADGGRSFALITGSLPETEQGTEHLALDPAAPDHLFLFSSYYGETSDRLRSDDGGATWTRADNVPTQSIVVSPKEGDRRFGLDRFFLLTSNDGASWSRVPVQGINGGTFTRLTIDPNVPRLFLGTTAGAYRSGNGGQSWLPLEGAARDPINAIDFDPVSGALTVGTNLGLFRSSGFPWNDWTDLHIDSNALTIDEVAADPTNGDVYAVVQRYLFRSADRGTSWQIAAPLLPGTVQLWHVTVGAAHDVYAFTQQDPTMNVLKLRADGTAWDPLPFKSVENVVADLSVPGTMYVVHGTVARSRDSGATWTQLETPSGSYISQLVVDAGDPTLLLAVGTNGQSRSIFKSTDGGRTWATIQAPISDINWIVATSHPGDFFLSAFSANYAGQALLRSVDGGDTWSFLPKQPPGVSLARPRNVLAVDRRDANVIYLATVSFGVMRSVDGGRSWQSIDGGLPAHAATLAIDAGDVLHAGTDSRGVWELAPTRRRVAGR